MTDEKRTQSRQERLEVLGVAQHGVVSTSQARSFGVSSWSLARSPRWERRSIGLYCLIGHPDSWHQKLMAAVLPGGEGTLVSHRAAAGLHGLDGVCREVVEVTIPRGHNGQRLSGAIVHRSGPFDRTDIGSIDKIPVTRATRTLIDLAGVVDRETLESALESALRNGQTSLPYLERRLGALGGKGHPGRALLRKVLAQRADEPPTESELETRFVQLCRRARLPAPARQHEVQLENRVARCDFAFEQARLLVELDGFATHASAADHRCDLRRQNAVTLARQGWTFLRYSWDDVVRRPSAVAAELRQALGPGREQPGRRAQLWP